MTHSLLPKLWSDQKNGGDMFSSLHREINRVFDQFNDREDWPFAALSPGNGKLSPRIDVSETDGAIEVTMELPGVDDNEIDVSLTDDRLTVKGEKKSESDKTEKDYRLVERAYGAFERMVRLPCEVDSDKIDAKFKNGILTITMPKSPTVAANTKKIAIASE